MHAIAPIPGCREGLAVAKMRSTNRIPAES
jgi:hypothetical protein